MNNTQLIDLSMNEMLTVAGGDGDPVTCFVLGVAFGAGLLGGPLGWAGALWAADSARREGCLN